jgi:hypothetical protein
LKKSSRQNAKNVALSFTVVKNMFAQSGFRELGKIVAPNVEQC